MQARDLRRAQAAPFSILCEVLGAGSVERQKRAAGLAAGRADWGDVFIAAGASLVTPTLAGVMSRMRLSETLSAEENDYLDAIRVLNWRRNETLRAELGRIVAALNRIDVRPILLKGAIALTPGQYPGAEDRVIGDLDLLVPRERLESCIGALTAMGYAPDDSPRRMLARDLRNMHHAPALLHPSLPVTVELHHRFLFDADDSALLAAGVRPWEATLENGAAALLPDPATRLLHNMLHAQVSNEQALTRALDLRQLVEFAALAHFYEGDLDPKELTRRLRQERHRLLSEYWALAERWLGLPYPDGMPRSRRERRELWFFEIIATKPAAFRFAMAAHALAKLPRRLANLIVRLWDNPAYFSDRLRDWFRKPDGDRAD